MKRIVTLLMISVALISILALCLGYGAGPRIALIRDARAQDSLFERARSKHCTLGTAKGVYGFALVGSVTGVGPVSTSGTTNFDGQGIDSGAFTVTTGDLVQHFTFTGTYTVNDDCTGAATLNITPSIFGRSTLRFEAVGADDANEIKWLITDPGIIIAGTLTKQ